MNSLTGFDPLLFLGITNVKDEEKNAVSEKLIDRISQYIAIRIAALLTEADLRNIDDPQKLKAIKQSLTENAEKYFTCLLQPGIPADNNKAERGLRHIVLKRKISYGSKSQKGADTMSILCSTLLSAWWNKPKNFFAAYDQMLSA